MEATEEAIPPTLPADPPEPPAAPAQTAPLPRLPMESTHVGSIMLWILAAFILLFALMEMSRGIVGGFAALGALILVSLGMVIRAAHRAAHYAEQSAEYQRLILAELRRR